ncbi:MAG TPA: TetR family transcriptional regulator [Micromonosporaceae bacterium]|nr:TetR family transcriptional regulator [Micromonosporaceae bacterium]
MNVTTSPARNRLLETATRLFYADGIQAIGVDRLVNEAKVTRATFYKQFPSKEDLVRAYLAQHDQRLRAQIETLAERARDPKDLVAALVDWLGELACAPGFRGCAFINAAAEYPDPGHPVRGVIAEHRRWLHKRLKGILAEAGHPRPDEAATTLILLRDGAMVGGYLDDPAAVTASLRSAVKAALSL